MSKFDLSSVEGYVSNHLRLFILSVAGLLFFLTIIAVSVFFIAIHGAEQTMVPDIRGKELTEALLELQVKELYPRIQLRHSFTSADRGLILEQDPIPGTIVKAGRRINLVVSQGVLINSVDNFIGRNIDDVRLDLQTVYLTPGGLPLLLLSEPVMYDFSAQPPGTIIAQKPEAGTDISGPIDIEFVVSRGRENAAVTVPLLLGLDIPQALEAISSSGINFIFRSRPARGEEQPETIVAQTPNANTVIPLSNVVEITLTEPAEFGVFEVFGIFSHSIPPNPYPLAVRLDVIMPTGERQRLFTVNYMGGEFTFPYKLPTGSILILTMMNREIHRRVVE